MSPLQCVKSLLLPSGTVIEVSSPDRELLGSRGNVAGNVLLGPLGSSQSVLGGAGGSPRALGMRFFDSLSVRARALGVQIVLGAALVSKNAPREAAGTLKIKVFGWTVCNI